MRRRRAGLFGLGGRRPLPDVRRPARRGGSPAATALCHLAADSVHRPARPHAAHRHQLHLPAPLQPLHAAQDGFRLRRAGGAGLHGARAPVAHRLPVAVLGLLLAALRRAAPEEAQFRGRGHIPNPGQSLRGGDAGEGRLGELSVGHGAEGKPDRCREEQRKTGGETPNLRDSESDVKCLSE